ncbi:MGMT family protein [Methylomonas albis]|uniref:Methylated-DNA--[protein]-cysteine S-methyltransferase n=1 Tax=Methylomonas albis TaxID=1854563 RepID=A0ABR9D4L5_9GAMM|nr:MGMT family protein [Methylomonas albis]MBD9358020.1 methylated-DNA--[protein]-cysteine S-methyltransferase [Methylomonas albis]
MCIRLRQRSRQFSNNLQDNSPDGSPSPSTFSPNCGNLSRCQRPELELILDTGRASSRSAFGNALQGIPISATTSYSGIARISLTEFGRAPESAYAANPLAIAIPCHRALRIDGDLSGYR